MADYRIYRVDMDGRVVSEFDTCCADDEAACVAALRVAEGHSKVEVWSGFRWVATCGRSISADTPINGGVLLDI